MKKLIAIFALSLLIVPTLVSAASFHSGDTYFLGKEEAISGDLYTAGNAVTLEGAVTGDAFGVGSTLLLTGNTSQDLQVLGGTVTFLGEVGDDARIAGGSVTFGGKVAGDALMGGGQVNISSGSRVEGDLVVGGGQVSVSGNVGGATRVFGGEVTLNGEFKGPIVVHAEKLTIGSQAVIYGGITYRSPAEAVVSPEAKVSGAIVYEPSAPVPNKGDLKAFAAILFGVWIGLKVFMLLVASLLLCLFLRKATERVGAETFERFGLNALLGFVFLVATPIAGILLCVTLVGGMIGGFVLVVYALALLIASIYLPAIVGGEIIRYWRKESSAEVSVLGIVLGVATLTLLNLIPFVGWIVSFALFLAVLGASLRLKWEVIQGLR